MPRTQDRYVTDGRLDIEAIRSAGHGRGAWCAECEENNPCSLAWAAERIGQLRATKAKAPR